MSMMRKEDSTLQPEILRVKIPAVTPIEAESVATVILLVTKKDRVRDEAMVDVEIPPERWTLAHNEMVVTWYPEAGDLPPGDYEGEVWIVDHLGRELKTPASGRVPIAVRPSLRRRSTD